MSLFNFSRYACARLGCGFLLILSIQSCEVPPEVRVTAANPPVFTFSTGTLVNMLLVYRLKPDEPKRGVFLDELLEDKTNLFWMIEGEHDQRLPIPYGTVPTGMKETVRAKPLMEGEYYLVFVGSLVGTRFVIRDGTAQPLK